MATQSNVKPSNVTVETRHFEFAHGKSPRGFGVWGFAETPSAAFEDVFFTRFSCSFADAKKQAKAWAAARGVFQVHVQS